MTTENPLAVAGAAKPKRVNMTAQEVCDTYNAHLREIGRSDVSWTIRDDKPVLDWTVRPHIAGHHLKHPMDRRGEPMSQDDTDKLNYCLASAGAKVRYDRYGGRFDAVTGEVAPRPGDDQ